jgi:peptidoglycan/LPS O-acetylase OafA/YrhL
MGTTSPATSAPSLNTDIECLRALAVLGVVVFHAQGNLYSPGLPWMDRIFNVAQTGCGVDLFFVISGFVIARSLLPRLQAASGDTTSQWHVVIAFWIRRAWRLLPSAWLWLVIMLLASIAANRSGVFQSIQVNLMATLAGLLNVANLRFVDTFPHTPYGASFVYWSLSLEEQFYILLPVLAVITRRYFPWILATLVVIQFFTQRSLVLMAFRTDALSAGVLLAMLSRTPTYARIEPRILGRINGSGGVILVLLLALMAVLAKLNMMHFAFAMAGVVISATTLVWIASYDANYLIRQGWLKRRLTWVGQRSYAIYLCHIPVFFLLREYCFRLGVLHPSAWALGLAATCLIVLMAALNFRFVEQPLRHYGRRVAEQFLERRKKMALPTPAVTLEGMLVKTGPQSAHNPDLPESLCEP